MLGLSRSDFVPVLRTFVVKSDDFVQNVAPILGPRLVIDLEQVEGKFRGV